MTTLYPYQREGAAWLAQRTHALLADEPGLGKSAQAIRACDAVGAMHILVLCPASLRVNWAREFAKFQTIDRGVHAILGGKVLGSDVTIASYDFATRYPEALAGAYDALILDESHYLKTRTSKRTKAVYGEKCDGVGGIVENCERVFCLTGTPTPNNPSELWPMLRALWPDAVEKPRRAYWGFVQRYCRTRDTGFGLEILGGKHLDELKAAIAPNVLRRKKEDVLTDLPPLRLDTLLLDGFDMTELSVLSKEFGAQIEQALAEHGIEGLRKIAPHVAQLRRVTGLLKAKAVADIVRDEAPAKIVLFAHHRDVIDTLFNELVAFGPVWVRGGDTPEQRQSAIDRFQNNPNVNVFIGQLQAAGVGLTLTAASEAIIVESSWVPAENEQAIMRIHRIGQRNACRARFATLANSIDEKINRAVIRKAEDIIQLFN